MSEILIIGANGQLAHDLVPIFKKYHRVTEATRSDFDVVDFDQVSAFISQCRPSVVINTAAFHNTSECEKNPLKAYQVNAIGSFNVAKASEMVGAKYVFYSTDYVFDGSKRIFYEDDQPNPLNVYGASKLAGEQLAKIVCSKTYIIRTSWLYGAGKSSKGYNFVSLMLEKANKGELIKVVDDQFGAPTYTLDLSKATLQLLEAEAPFGIYHMTNGESTSWYGFAKEIFRLSHITPHLEPAKTDETENAVKRPKFSVLKSRKLKNYDIEPIRPWSVALESFLINSKVC